MLFINEPIMLIIDFIRQLLHKSIPSCMHIAARCVTRRIIYHVITKLVSSNNINIKLINYMTIQFK